MNLPSLLGLHAVAMVPGWTVRATRQLMTNLKRLQGKVRELVRSGKFHGVATYRV